MLRSRLGQLSAEINDIGNLRLLGATDNIRKRAELPDSYFSRLRASGVDIEKHWILSDFSTNPNTVLFSTQTYTDFRVRRRQEIWKIVKRVVDLDHNPQHLPT